MSKFDGKAYLDSLPTMPIEELCDRLRGKYADKSYGHHPLFHEAARRLEHLTARVAELEGQCSSTD